jgi:hypothetical protein
MMLRNDRYLDLWHGTLIWTINCCCAIFQHGVDFTWQFWHSMSFCHMCVYKLVVIVKGCQLIIQVLFQMELFFAIDIAYFKCCSTTQIMIIMDISSIMMAFSIFSFSMTLLGLGRINKYPCTGMQNVMCSIVAMEHKQKLLCS